MELVEVKNYIGGVLKESSSKEWLDNPTPIDGVLFSKVTNSNAQDAHEAIAAAKQAYPVWSALKMSERASYLKRLSIGIRSRFDEFVQTESLDNGKPVKVSQTVDIPRSISNLNFFAELSTALESQSYLQDNELLSITMRESLGVVACISPWNLPLYLLTWKIAPALIMGNTVVAKPSEVTPVTAYLLSSVCDEIGLPKGVLNIIHGEGVRVGETLCTHPDVKAISFTGSTLTGRTIATMAAPHFKKVSLEMGGKNPTIVFDDCDFDSTVKQVTQAAFANQGQICLCGSRIYVQKGIYEKFKEAMLAQMKKIKIGHPLLENTTHGAMVSRAHFEKVIGHIKLAKEEGGHILAGGGVPKLDEDLKNGFYIEPTLIEGLSHECRTNQEEIFGPVATIEPFESIDEVITKANSTKYGLSASVWSTNTKTTQKMMSKLHAGLIWINTWMARDLRTPFGGMKESGVGREGGMFALNFFSEPKNVCIKLEK